jgi:2'-5' RNA ligase
MEEQRIRAFISIRSPKEVMAKISSASSTLDRSWAKLSREQGMPITLFFFESISTHDVELIIKAMDLVHAEKFSIKVKGVDVFIPRSPRVLFASIEQNRGLQELHAGLKTLLEGVGIPVEMRPFTPHITIARMNRPNMKELSDFLSKYKGFEFGEFECTEIKFSKSDITGEGPTYTDLHVKHLD